MVFNRKKKVVPFRSAGELDAMQAAGAIVGATLVAVRAAAKPGVSTLELDEVARSEERRVGKECVSTFSSRWSPDHYITKNVLIRRSTRIHTIYTTYKYTN